MERTNRNNQSAPEDINLKLLAGRVLNLIALAQGLPMAIIPAVGGPQFLELVLSFGTISICMGVAGYALGSHKLGAAAIFGTMAAIMIGMAMGQGMIPGISPTDTSLPSSGA